MSTRPPGHGPAGRVIGRLVDEEAPRGVRIPRQKMRTLLPLFRPYLGRTVAALALMVVTALAGLAGPAMAQLAIDHGIQARDKGTLVLLVGLFLLAGVVGWVAGYGQSYLSSWVGERVLLDLRNRVFRHMMRLSLGHHERTPTGVSVSRLTSDIEAMVQLVSDGATTLVVSGLSFVGVIVILFLYDWQLAVLAFAVFPPLALGTAWFRVASARAYRATRERVALVLAALQETISGIRVVQAFGRQREAEARFARVNDDYRAANLQTVRVSALYFPGVELLAGLGTVLILWFGGRRVLGGDISIGVLVAFLGYLSSFFDPIQSLSQLYNTFQSAMAALEKILGVLETEPRIADAPGAHEITRVDGHVRLEDVSFGYDREYVIRGVTLDIPAGATVALVGATGAGKSTLAKLIARFYDPDEGRVLLDGRDLREVSERSLRRHLGIVPQEGFLFSGSVAQNLRFARPEASDEDLRAACEAVGALEFVESLPEGFQTDIQERGGRLSAGQRQLLSFARAVVADPRLLILDEATSAVDLQTERHIELALQRLLAGRTAVVIAHRLSTIRGADRIVVLHEGRIVEQGTHDDLLQSGGRYADLYAAWEGASQAA